MRLLKIVILGALCMICSPSLMANDSESKVIVFNQFLPSDFIVNQGIINPWIEDIERVTEGRIKIKIPEKNLAQHHRQMDGAIRGRFDGGYIFNAFLDRQAPLIQLSLLPLTTHSAEADSVALWRTHQKFFANKKEYEDVVLLGFFAGPGGQVFSMDKPIKSVSDLRISKVWSSPGDAAKALGRLRVLTKTGSAPNIYSVLSSGEVTGFIGLNYTDAKGFRATDFAKSSTEIEGNIFSPSFSVFLNRDTWNSISEKDQELIMSVSGENLARRSRAWDELEIQNRNEFKSSGKEIFKASKSFMKDIREQWMPILNNWVEEANAIGIDGQAALDYYLSEAKEVYESTNDSGNN